MKKERLKIRSDPALVVLLPLGMTSFPTLNWQVHLGKNRVFLNFHTCWPPENFHSSYHLTLGSWNMEIFCRFYCETMRSMDWWFMGAARTLGDTLVVGYALRFTTWCNIWLCFCLQDETRGFSGIQTEGWHLQKKHAPGSKPKEKWLPNLRLDWQHWHGKKYSQQMAAGADCWVCWCFVARPKNLRVS